MNLVALDSLLTVVFVALLIFLPALKPNQKKHLDFLVGGQLNITILVVLTLILSNYGFPISTFFALLFVLEAHERVNLVEQFRTYFGLKRQCNTELCA